MNMSAEHSPEAGMALERRLLTLKKFASILGVSLYLVLVGSFLVLTRRIRVSPSKLARVVTHRLLAPFRQPFSAELTEVVHDKGHCYVAHLGRRLVSDLDGRSRLRLFENGLELPHPHSVHDHIRSLGEGRYSHWGNDVFFSSSDNTDSSANGRRYTVKEV